MTVLAVRPPSQPVTDAWRAAVKARLVQLGITQVELARRAETNAPMISLVLSGRYSRTPLVAAIDRALDMGPAAAPPSSDPPEVVDPRVADVAELREARDAIQDDIVRLETARAAIEERLAEAYEHRASLDIRIRELRGARAP